MLRFHGCSLLSCSHHHSQLGSTLPRPIEHTFAHVLPHRTGDDGTQTNAHAIASSRWHKPASRRTLKAFFVGALSFSTTTSPADHPTL